MAIVSDKVFIDIVTDTKKGQANLLKFAAVAGTAAAAIAGIYKVGKDLIDAYKVQEIAETKLAAALKATGDAVGISKYEMLEMASALQGVTTFSDEAIIGAQGLLTTFTKIGKEVFPDALEVALDMSVMFGQDLKQSSISLGKALNEPITGVGRLQEVGVSFTETQKDSIKAFMEQNDIISAQGVILDELKAEFGGVAKAAGEMATASIDQLGNAFTDLKQAQGEALARGLAPYIRGLTDLVTKLGEARVAMNEDAEYMDRLGKVQVTAAESLRYWQNQLELAESKNWLEKIWMRARWAKSIQSKELIEARIKEYELQVKLEKLYEQGETRRANAAKDELVALKEKADELERVEDVHVAALIRLNELQEEDLTASELKLKRTREELELRKEQKASLEKYGDAWQAVEDVILELLDDEEQAVKDVAEERAAANKEAIEGTKELTKHLTDQLVVIEKLGGRVSTTMDWLLFVMEEGLEKELLLLAQVFVERLNLAKETGEDEVAILELFEIKKEEIRQKYRDIEAAAIEEKFQFYLDLAQDYGEILGTTIAEGSAAGWEKFMDIAQDAIANVLLMFAKEWAVLASAAYVLGDIPDAIRYGAAAVVATAGAGAISAMAEGGIIDEPVYGVGRSGQKYLFGESGPEEVRPINRASSSRVNFDIHGNTFVGTGGVREFAITLRKEFNSLDTLGL